MNDDTNNFYKRKYLKYKNKYIEFKKQIGSGKDKAELPFDKFSD